MKTFELIPTNGQKSFYNKAIVSEYINSLCQVKQDLLSYGTKVAEYNTETKVLKISGNDAHFTQTTNKHINSFLEFNNLPTMNKKELLNFNNRTL